MSVLLHVLIIFNKDFDPDTVLLRLDVTEIVCLSEAAFWLPVMSPAQDATMNLQIH